MGWPRFCIINGNRAVKAVETVDGGLAVLEYIPAHNEYGAAMKLLLRFSFADTDTEFVSEEEFVAFVTSQRDDVKRRCGILSPDEADG